MKQRDSWLVRHTWKYVVRDPDTNEVHYVSGTKRDALRYADVYTSLLRCELQVRRISTWWKAGDVWGSWMVGGFFDDTPDGFGVFYE